MSNSDRLLDMHNKGQEDASKGIDSEPHSLFRASFNPFVSPSRFEQMMAENEAYSQGQENHRNQTR